MQKQYAAVVEDDLDGYAVVANGSRYVGGDTRREAEVTAENMGFTVIREEIMVWYADGVLTKSGYYSLTN